MSERTLYLHVGTHKTGTTSIQAFLAMNAAALASVGVYVARTGRPARRCGSLNIGNHNVAWDLSALPNFRPDEGTFEELIAELAACDAPTAVVSSEDLEWLHDKPETLARVLEAVRSAGFELRIVAYLRAQPEYIQALYTENAKAGYPLNFAAVLAGMLERGAWVTTNPPVSTSLDYAAFLDGFASVVGRERLIVRAYRPGGKPSDLLGEFLQIAGAGGLPFEALLQPAALNPTPSLLAALTAIYEPIARLDPSAPPPGEIVASVLEPADRQLVLDKFDVLTLEETRRVYERFAPSNRDVERRYGATAPMCVESDLRPRSKSAWDAVEKRRRVLEAAMRAWNVTAASP